MIDVEIQDLGTFLSDALIERIKKEIGPKYMSDPYKMMRALRMVLDDKVLAEELDKIIA